MSKDFEKLEKKDQSALKKWCKNKLTDKEYAKIKTDLVNQTKFLLKTKEKITGKDYFISAIILHHKYQLNSSKKAVEYAQKAVKNGHKKGKWLVASTTDRLLQLQGKPQKFGTQVIDIKAKKLQIYKLNPKTTDKERQEYGLPTLKELKEYYDTN